MLRQAIVIAALAASAAPAFANDFIAFSAPGARYTTATSINSGGDAAGYYSDQRSRTRGFVRLQDGTIETFDVPQGGASVSNFKINDQGEVLGQFKGRNKLRAFLRRPDGTIKTFGAPGMTYTYPAGLSATGIVAGFASNDPAHESHGFVRRPNGRFELFDVCGAFTAVRAINGNGTVAGVCSDDGIHAINVFTRDMSGAVKLIDGHGSYMLIRAINNAGTIAGNADNCGFVMAPDGTKTTFQIILHKRHPIASCDVEGMNADGTIVGSCLDYDGRSYAFLRRPDGNIRVFTYPIRGAFARATAINDSNVITGSFSGFGTQETAFLKFPDER